MSVWDDFYQMSILRVEFKGSTNAKNAVIFGNGLNQVAVVIHVKMLNKNRETLIIPYEELLERTHLVNYSTGEKLNYKGNLPNNEKPWIYSNVDSGYNYPYQYSLSTDKTSSEADAPEDGAFEVVYYISATDANAGIDIGAGINVPGVGEFNSTYDGTSAPSGSGTWTSPSYIHVKALDKIDYSLEKNIKTDNNPTGHGSFHILYDNMKVIHNNWAGVDYDNYEGISSKVSVVISPAPEGFRFTKMNVLSPTVTSNFKIAGGGCDTVWGTHGNNYDATFIFINREHYGLLPNNSIHTKCGGEDYYYIIGASDARQQWTEKLSEGVITVHMCNHRTPRSDAHQQGWSDSGKEMRVQVTDTYGNTGVVSINVYDESWPKLHVNN